MKNIIKTVLAVAITLCFFACNEDYIDPMAGKYPVPTDYTLTSLVSQNVVKNDNGTRTVTLQLSGEGTSFTADFVVNDYYLKANSYTLATAATAKNGNYCTAQVNGVEITAGNITVTLAGESDYTIKATLMLADGTFARIEYAGAIVFVADPPVMTYTLDVQKPYAWTMDGETWNVVDGSQLNKITVKADGATVAYLEIVTAEKPSSLSGTYPVSGMITDVNGAVVQGMYMDLSAYVPGVIIESGSYLYEDDDKNYISAGNITIVDNAGTLAISSSNLVIVDKATGGVLPQTKSIEYNDVALEGGGGGATHTNLYSASALDLSMFGLTGFTVTLKVATPDLTINAEQGPMGATYTYAGSGQYISFDFSTSAAALPVGTYNVVDNTTAQVGDCLAGYPSLFGTGFMGTFVGNVVDGVATEEVVSGGTVEITDNGFNFNLTTANGTITGSYTGTIVLQ